MLNFNDNNLDYSNIIFSEMSNFQKLILEDSIFIILSTVLAIEKRLQMTLPMRGLYLALMCLSLGVLHVEILKGYCLQL